MEDRIMSLLPAACNRIEQGKLDCRSQHTPVGQD